MGQSGIADRRPRENQHAKRREVPEMSQTRRGDLRLREVQRPKTLQPRDFGQPLIFDIRGTKKEVPECGSLCENNQILPSESAFREIQPLDIVGAKRGEERKIGRIFRGFGRPLAQMEVV